MTASLQHLTADEIEQWAVGVLGASRAIHLAQCADCFAAAERERKFFRELAQLARLAPAADFADKVMAQVRIPTPSGGFERREPARLLLSLPPPPPAGSPPLRPPPRPPPPPPPPRKHR